MSRGPEGAVTKSSHAGWVVFAIFSTAVVLFLNPIPFVSPVPAASRVPSWATDVTPVRQPTMAPLYASGVYTYKCSDCHKILPSPPETQRTLNQHTEIHLQHGLNARCFNCHHPTNRDVFIDDMGGEIPWDQPQLLCAKCHGPVFRDWQHGSHGRTNGYWDLNQGEQTRRKCIECHDPHHPPFPALQPAPGPNTLRMGQQDFGTHGHGHNPLQINNQASRHRSSGVEERASGVEEEGH
jgi:hypothetical protein